MHGYKDPKIWSSFLVVYGETERISGNLSSGAAKLLYKERYFKMEKRANIPLRPYISEG